MTNAVNSFNPNANVNQEENAKKNYVYLNLKVTTNSGDVRRFSFLLRNSGTGFEQSNANTIITNAVAKSETSLEEANAYLAKWFADPEKWNPTDPNKKRQIEASCYLSGIKSSNKDWVDDI